MISRFIFSLVSVLLLSSCASPDRQSMPHLLAMAGKNPRPAECAKIFPTGHWQLSHVITFALAGGSGTVVGVLVLNGEEIRCALVSVEGLTLFAAQATGSSAPEVTRALPPFDKPGFAEGLMRDIRTIFSFPPGNAEYGQLADGAPVCRYSGLTVTDVLPEEGGCWSIATYSGQTRSRLIRARSCRMIGSTAVAEELELVAAQPAGYTLNMQLISAEHLPATKGDLP
ncbi:MAG: hypothetical protein V2I32_04500 [Desulforhopalus sp.]|jgi:hypothetical protein|nr:hypothetical protein [Desulforhopalus sp.]